MATYVKNTWESGDTITAVLMNHIEEGIETIDNNLVSLDTTLTQEGDAAEAKAVGEQLNTKANVDGYYEELTSGSAEQLLSSKFTEDGVPYVYRKTGGSLDVGNRKLEKIVGGTVVWNQLVQVAASSTTQNGVTITANADGSVVFDGTATGNVLFNAYPASPIPTGHVILITGCPSGGSTASYFLADGYGIGTYDIGKGKVYRVSGTQQSTIAQHRIQSGTVCDNLVFKPQIFDLTKMFGATIADYVLSLDTANSGAGLAWFRSMFPLYNYAYNEGELMSVQATQHETVGFNQWDEEWELGTFGTSSGADISRTDQIRSKNLIPVIPGATYYFSTSNGAAWTMFFDENGNIVNPPTLDNSASWLTSGYCIGITNRTFTMPQNAHYIRFYITQSYGGTYKHDICLNLSWTGYRNGEYEPYSKHTRALQENLTLRGVPKLDANNHIYYDGDTYEADGTVTRRYDIIDLGTLSWSYNSSLALFYSNIADAKYYGDSKGGPCVCGNYDTTFGKVYSGWSGFPDKSISCGNTYSIGSLNLCVKDTSYTDAAAFKVAMSGVMLVYELATPTTEQAAPYPEVQTVDDFGTERFVDSRPVAIPVGHSTKYMSNLRDKLQHLPDLAASDGDYMIHQANGQMTLTPSPLPAAPSQNGTYVLKCIVSNGTPTYSWEVQS